MTELAAERAEYALGSTSWTVTVEAPQHLRNGRVYFRDQLVGSWETPRELRPRLTIALQDGSLLTVRRVWGRGFGRNRDIDIRRDGLPLSGSARDPTHKVTTAAGSLALVGGLTAVFGVLAILSFGIRLGLATGLSALAVAALCLALAKQARRGSIAALAAGIGLSTLNIIFGFHDSNVGPNIELVLGSLALIGVLARGIIGVRQHARIEEAIATFFGVPPNPSLQRTLPGRSPGQRR